MVDSEKVPAMGFIYGAMDSAKEEIAKNLGGEESSYKEIWNIIDEKWEFQLHRHLHAAAYFLNPHFQYEDNFSNHPEIKLGLYTCMDKLIVDENERGKADLQIDSFRRREGFFGFQQAITSCKKRSPVDWWTQFGDETPELAKFAIKVLSLTCSASGCERNWSTFNQVHTKKRNRLSSTKLNNLVYIMYNKRLKDRHLKRKGLKEEVDPLVVDDVPSDDEWIVGNNNESREFFVEHDDDNINLYELGEGSSTQQRSSARHPNIRSQDKGKRPMTMDEEEWVDNESDNENEDDTIRYDDDSMEDPISDSDNDIGEEF